jgi:hypothetical protein
MISLQNKRAYSQNTLEKQELDENLSLEKEVFHYLCCLLERGFKVVRGFERNFCLLLL